MKWLSKVAERVGFVCLTLAVVVFSLATGLLATASMFAAICLPVAALVWLCMQVFQ